MREYSIEHHRSCRVATRSSMVTFPSIIDCEESSREQGQKQHNPEEKEQPSSFSSYRAVSVTPDGTPTPQAAGC